MPADSGRLKKDRVDVFLRGVSENTVQHHGSWSEVEVISALINRS